MPVSISCYRKWQSQLARLPLADSRSLPHMHCSMGANANETLTLARGVEA